MKHSAAFWTRLGLGVLALLPATGLLGGCDGSATQTTNDKALHGTLVDGKGGAVPGAKVQAWPATEAGSAQPFGTDHVPAAIAQTDDQGRYALTGLDAGVYNVYAEKGIGASVRIPGIRYQAQEQDLGEDTLSPPGIVTGKVLVGGFPLTGAFCYIPGSAFIAMTDSSGDFVLARVPAGSYPVRYTLAGYVSATDSPAVVLSGDTTALAPKTLALDLTLQPSTPKGLQVSVDTLNGFVTLKWNRVDIADVIGYELEVRNPNSTGNFLNRIVRPIHDTSYVDDMSMLAFQYGHGAQEGQDSVTVIYRLRAVDQDGNVSPARASDTLQLHRPESHKTRIRLFETGSTVHSPVCRDTLQFITDFQNSLVDTATIQWYVAGFYAGADLPAIKEIITNEGPDGSAFAQADSILWIMSEHPAPTPANGPITRWQISTTLGLYPLGLKQYERRIIDIDRTAAGCYTISEPRLFTDSEQEY